MSLESEDGSRKTEDGSVGSLEFKVWSWVMVAGHMVLVTCLTVESWNRLFV